MTLIGIYDEQLASFLFNFRNIFPVIQLDFFYSFMAISDKIDKRYSWMALQTEKLFTQTPTIQSFITITIVA